ncbi:hypothetical protein NQ176_g7961 [Zarea fungicola]|uniref:Uncharacterized protein n=1 Tax=Zarea fungicola TaxID=93591 RepID=A0ACC1MV75_9HYPO|nr:hypothetical protein NQ176_g7961 [Lecanicillium fungicola]
MFSYPQCVGWDSIVALINPAKNSVTCVGYAPSQGRRCWNPRNKEARGYANGILANMEPLENGIDGKTQQDLCDLAYWALCNRHRHQTMQIAFKWERMAEKAMASQYTAPPCQGQYHYRAETQREEMLDEILERLKRMEENLRGNSTQDRFNARQQRPCAWSQPPSSGQSFNTFGRAPFTPQPPKPEPFDFFFNIGADSNCRKPKESTWREPDQKPKSKTGFFTPPATPPPPSPGKPAAAQPKSAASPVIRPAAKQAAKSERQVWDEIWSKYLADWASLDETPEEMDVKIPWPTKSGKLDDVTEASVKRFFWDGPCHGKMAGEEWFSIMSAENKRWHTDKITARFGPGAVVEQHKEVLDLIARQVIELWKESRRSRHSS